MLLMDPPDHTRLRKLVVKAFTTGAVERKRRRIADIADELLDDVDRLAADRAVDLIETFAAPRPMQVISEIFGVSTDYREPFRTAVEFMLATTDPVGQYSSPC